ncbi:3-isopropylmalate dehydratase small subunit [Devosia sp.]|uniref:3-isopropylmalate dehydratase small subunit n=1 Tax=Devosia sp. TaxID=1871048 RepID=UPI002EFBEE2A
MESFTRITAIAAPLMRINIDTDQIVPGKELVRVRSEGYAASLFASWRYIGEREPNPEFILNIAPWNRAQILLADRNFGCGSSREAAPMALRAWGFRAVIAPSFGGIFYNNCFRNGLLPVELAIEDVEAIASLVMASNGSRQVSVDLDAGRVSAADRTWSFDVPATLREMLLKGLDQIDLTLSRMEQIARFRERDRQVRPWAYEVARVRA